MIRPRAAVLVPLSLLVLAAFVVLAATGLRLLGMARDNAAIAALAEGRDLPVAADASPRLLFARAHFLTTRGRLDEAQPVVDLIALRGDPDIAAAASYDLANARLAHAIDLLERARIDPAVPEVRLAKAGYRNALSLQPGFWDAKYNLDVAMRLIRDFPDVDGEPKEEPQQAPKRVWTDLPGLPKGLP